MGHQLPKVENHCDTICVTDAVLFRRETFKKPSRQIFLKAWQFCLKKITFLFNQSLSFEDIWFWINYILGDDTVRITYLDMLWRFSFRFKPIFATVTTGTKNNTQFKSGQKWLENNHLALLVLIRDTLCSSCCAECKYQSTHLVSITFHI